MKGLSESLRLLGLLTMREMMGRSGKRECSFSLPEISEEERKNGDVLKNGVGINYMTS